MKNKIRAYQSEIRAEEIGFTNYEGIDESELFDIVVNQLNKCDDIKIGKKQVGPSEDFYECSVGGLEFTLFNDIDYSTSIYAKEPHARKKIIERFNQD